MMQVAQLSHYYWQLSECQVVQASFSPPQIDANTNYNISMQIPMQNTPTHAKHILPNRKFFQMLIFAVLYQDSFCRKDHEKDGVKN